MPSVNTPEHTRSFVVQGVAGFNKSRDMVQVVKEDCGIEVVGAPPFAEVEGTK